MHVVCERCQARYEFESSAIPQEGYEAQCSHCDARFFVAPKGQVHKGPPAAASSSSSVSAPADSHAGEDKAGEDKAGAGADFAHDMAATLAAEGEASRGEAQGPGSARGKTEPRHRPSLASLFDDDLHHAPPAAKAGSEAASADAAKEADEMACAAGKLEPGLRLRRSGRPTGSRRQGPAEEDELNSSFLQLDTKFARNRDGHASGGRDGHRPAAKAAAPGSSRRRGPMAWAHVTSPARKEEPGQRRSRARLGFVVGMVCVALVTLGVVVGVARSERLHLPTQVPPPLHIVHDPPQAAIEAYERGLAALMHDNEADLNRAAEAFAAAHGLDEDYTDAWAGEALACLLRGQDARERLLHAGDEAALAGQQVLALAEAQGARAHVLLPHEEPGSRSLEGADAAEQDNDGEQNAQEAQEAHDSLQSSQRALEIASASLKMRAMARSSQQAQARLVREVNAVQQDLAHAASLLFHANQLPAHTPLLATVLALWYADDASARALVLPQLKIAEQLGAQVVEQPRRTWSSEPTPQAPVPAPFAAWRMLARARIAAAEQGDKAPSVESDPVVVALEAALRLDPNFSRARWQLASYLIAHGRAQEAGPHVRQLAQAQPRHERGFALWQRWSAIEQAGTQPVSATPVP